jgi:hypothetical protein
MNLNTYEKNLSSCLDGDTLLAGYQDGYLRKMVNDHIYIVITMFGIR